MKVILQRLRSFIFMCVWLLASTCHLAFAQVGNVVIIIDDMGYRESDRAVFSLPKEITVSVLPDSPKGLEWSHLAAQQGRDVMLHLPMEATSQNTKLGPHAIMTSMYPVSIHQTLAQALQSVPHAIGVNNHMGSLLTTKRLPMNALMDAVKANNLFFVDSLTSPNSLASKVAKAKGVASARRQVFLDHIQTREFMEVQMAQLIRIAKKRGIAIGIAHPHPATIEYLHEVTQTLHQEGIELLPVSEFFAPQQLLIAKKKVAGAQKNQQVFED